MAPPSTRRSDASTIRREARADAALVTHGLEEQQRVGDAVAGKGIDHEALLVGGGDLLGLAVEVEDALVEIIDGVDERHLPVEAGRRDDALGLAEAQARAPARSDGR